jgi:hypothetical protein
MAETFSYNRIRQTVTGFFASKFRFRAGFYVGMAAFAVAAVFYGFAYTFYLRWMFDLPALSLLLFVHGIVFTSWFLLFAVQTMLVAAHRTDVHRRLGIAGALLAVLVTILGTMTAIYAARTGFSPAPEMLPPLAFLIKPLGDMVLFAGLVGAGVYFRRRSAIHKRLMLLGTVTMLSPALARWPIFGGNGLLGEVFILVFLLACFVGDFVQYRRVHPVFVWGSLVIVLSAPLRIIFAGTDAWLAFAQWVTS